VTGKAPCELLFNRTIKTRIDLVKPKAACGDQVIPAHRFNKGDRVFMRAYLKGKKWVIGEVQELLGNCWLRIKSEDRVHKRHFEQVRPCFVEVSPAKGSVRLDEELLAFGSSNSPTNASASVNGSGSFPNGASDNVNSQRKVPQSSHSTPAVPTSRYGRPIIAPQRYGFD